MTAKYEVVKTDNYGEDIYLGAAEDASHVDVTVGVEMVTVTLDRDRLREFRKALMRFEKHLRENKKEVVAA